jgi:hypothetical protein
MNALRERPVPVTAGGREQDALLLGFERQGKILGRIPMVVRLNLDLCGLSFGLDDWVALDLETRIALSSLIADTPQAQRMWTRMVFDSVAAACPCAIDPSELLGMDCPQPPARINVQLQAMALESIDSARWAALGKLQRYALLKLSRPGHKNRGFEKVARDAVSRQTRDATSRCKTG